MDYFENIDQTVATALQEDIGDGDITASLIDAGREAGAQVISRQTAVICGQPWVNEVIRQVNRDISIDWQVTDGDLVQPNDTLFTLYGNARDLLTAERTMLNFLQMLSGTATRTRQYVELIQDTNAVLLDTRKTIPGLRLAQKYSVKIGGAENHRIGLFDAFLIKENHIEAVGSITEAIFKAKQIKPGVKVEVEVETLAQLHESISAKPDWIMLDNFTLTQMAEAVEVAKGTTIKLEASGGIESSDELLEIALTGVDYISIGALTKHCEAIDLSMRFE